MTSRTRPPASPGWPVKPALAALATLRDGRVPAPLPAVRGQLTIQPAPPVQLALHEEEPGPRSATRRIVTINPPEEYL